MSLQDETPHPDLQGRQSSERPRLHLRLLETTDVHSNLLPFDYYADTCETTFGLARTANLIHEARAEAANCLLFDNGDFLQGTPLSDLTAQSGTGWTGAHPAVMAMNYLNYDAAGIGNHEFNFGLDWLRAALADADFPVTCANAVTAQGAAPTQDKTLFAPYLILDRALVDQQGGVHDLRIGVIALVPPQITTWDHFHLQGRLTARDMLEALAAWVPQVRSEGADIVVVLAHCGIDAHDYYPMKENAALALAELPGVDAILAGHTHEIFPDPAAQNIAGADHIAGTLNGTPSVMAGFRGAHLGVLDLYLSKGTTGWSVEAHHSEARSVASDKNAALTQPDAALKQLLKPPHEQTLGLIRMPVGQTDAPLHSYLALVRNDAATQLVSRAKRDAIERMVLGTADAALPVLATSAPFKTGGRGGPKYYSDVPPGDFRLRNAVDLYAFPNTLCALRLTGAQLRDWLERAASCFNRIQPGQQDQPLLNDHIPGHIFDVIDGLSYVIDLSQPAQYDAHGRCVDPSAHRIVDLCHDGHAIDEDGLFLLATNSFRAYGGGPYPKMSEGDFAITSRTPIRDILVQYVRERGPVEDSVDPIWTFAPMPDTSVTIDTGPGVRRYMDEIEALGATDIGNTDAGFARFRLSLAASGGLSLANLPRHAYVNR